MLPPLAFILLLLLRLNVCLESNLMVGVESTQSISSGACTQAKPHAGSGFEDQLELGMADRLIKTTRQYKKWQEIRQKDPAKAQEIARLVLERHSWVEGKTPATPEDRIHFDRLTEQLWKHSIYLYKSYQFSDPLLFGDDRAIAEQETSPRPPHSTDKATGQQTTPLARELNQRHAKKDCYEFLAGLLEENGIAYYGKDGIANHLIDKARQQDLNSNAYLTGEAVTELLCHEPVVIHLPQINEQSFERLWENLKPHLEEGAILSYSSQHFGHTGIVSRSGEQWDYINSSGLIGSKTSYRIKEEDLKTEIHGWLERAKKSHTFLSVTVGHVDPERAALFSKTSALSPSPNAIVNLLA
jgi:hypothetical protein